MSKASDENPRTPSSIEVADSIPAIDLDSFDITVAGWLVGEEGPIKHNVTFNAYKVLLASYERRGLKVEPAELIHDALRVVHDHERLRKIESPSEQDVKTGRMKVAFRKIKGER